MLAFHPFPHLQRLESNMARGLSNRLRSIEQRIVTTVAACTGRTCPACRAYDHRGAVLAMLNDEPMPEKPSHRAPHNADLAMQYRATLLDALGAS